MATKPPDEHEIVEMLADMQNNIYADQDTQIGSTRETRELRKKITVPNAWVDSSVQDPTVADEIGRVSDTLNVNGLKWRIERPLDAPDTVQTNATLREKVAAGIFGECGMGEDGLDTVERMVDTCVGDGGAWGKFLFDKDRWEERYALKQGAGEAGSAYVSRTDEAAKRAGPPFYFGYADPLSVNPTFSGRKLGSMIEVSERPLYSTFRKYRLTVNNKQIVPGDIGQSAARTNLPNKVQFIEYWDPEWCVYVIKGDTFSEPYAVKPYRHKYGRVPYFPAFGFMMGHWTNRKVGWGIAQTKVFLVDYMTYLLKVHANVAARDALTPVLNYLGENSQQPALGEKKQPRKIPIGEIIDVPFGNKYEGFPITDTAPALREQIAMIGDKIEKMLTPRVTSQIGGGLEGAGFAINQVLAESRIHHRAFKAHLERCFEQMTYFMEDLIRDKVQEKVWVYVAGNKNYLGEDKNDLDSAVRWSVELDPERPAAKLIESRYHIEQVDKGMESLDMAIEAQGRNADEVRLGKDADAIRNSPEVQAWRKEVILQKMGYGHLMLLTQQAQQVAQTGQFPNGQPIQAMGGPEVPDMGKLAAAPNQTAPDNAGGPVPNNGNMGTSPGAVQPMAREAQAA